MRRPAEKVTLCRCFNDDSEKFAMILKKQFKPFSTGVVCSPPTAFAFKILMRE